MTNWEPQDLDTIGAADELDIAPRHDDARAEHATTIWVVRVDDDLYVRSYRGRDGRWFQRACEVGGGVVRAGGIERAVTFEPHGVGDRDAIDTAYRTKYGQYDRTYVDPMVSDDAAATTLRLVPR
jgi:hypothetical protein